MTERRCNEMNHCWHDAGTNPNTGQARIRCKACGDIREVSQEEFIEKTSGKTLLLGRNDRFPNKPYVDLTEEEWIAPEAPQKPYDPRPGLAVERDKLQNQLAEVRETLDRTEATLKRVHVLIGQWREDAGTLHPSQHPQSPSWLTDCAEELERALENE